MKHILPILWWLGAVPIIAMLLVSVDYPLIEALAVAVMFLPGMFYARYFVPQLRFEVRKEGIYHSLCLLFAVLTTEYFSIFLANYYLSENGLREVPPILINPLFLLLIVAVFVFSELWIEQRLTAHQPDNETISFTSDRRKITLPLGEIAYIESNDNEVWIWSATGDSYRTKTRISQWETQLDPRFVRIHRAYIVNLQLAGEITAKRITILDKTIEISRKYKEAVRQLVER